MSNSKECQDYFVLSVLDNKMCGTYLEVGGAWPINDNNTYLLESKYAWRGVSIEYDGSYASQWVGVRNNPCIQEDATKIDYTKLLEELSLGTHIDYLQLDIDPYDGTFEVLNKIDFNTLSFSVITYEHDLSSGGTNEREKSRKILSDYGYTRVISDVMHKDIIFEDWYINERYMPNNNWQRFIGENIVMNKANIDTRYADLFRELLI